LDREGRILGELTPLFCDIFLRDDLVLTPATSAADVPGWDSIKQIEIIVAVEEKYGVRIRAREVDALRTVGDLVSLIAGKTV
jgi:acyl carrier protein